MHKSSGSMRRVRRDKWWDLPLALGLMATAAFLFRAVFW